MTNYHMEIKELVILLCTLKNIYFEITIGPEKVQK